ncbi:hypothetical protein [Rubritalea sp.]|uniref:hypothetical protein n=1 Tax=Rubritalea sp. TaxID=2109375 RepID=UPI003EF3D8FA
MQLRFPAVKHLFDVDDEELGNIKEWLRVEPSDAETELLASMREQLMTRLDGRRRVYKNGSEGTLQRRDQFVCEMSALADELGLRPESHHRNTLDDIGYYPRLSLIWETMSDLARGAAKWEQSCTSNLLNAAPAQELILFSHREHPKDWAKVWRNSGGKFTEGSRMIALKTDSIWQDISRFDLPYPAFDFDSGETIRNVRRREAESLGLVKQGEHIKFIQ